MTQKYQHITFQIHQALWNANLDLNDKTGTCFSNSSSDISRVAPLVLSEYDYTKGPYLKASDLVLENAKQISLMDHKSLLIHNSDCFLN